MNESPIEIMKKKELFEIRCPFQRLGKQDGKLYQCNSLCVKVAKGSAGEARCRKCHLNFEFELDTNAKLTTGVRIKPINGQD